MPGGRQLGLDPLGLLGERSAQPDQLLVGPPPQPHLPGELAPGHRGSAGGPRDDLVEQPDQLVDVGAGLVVLEDQAAVDVPHHRVVRREVLAQPLGVDDVRERLARQGVGLHGVVGVGGDPAVAAEGVVDVGRAAARHGVQHGACLADDDVGGGDVDLRLQGLVGVHADLDDLDAEVRPGVHDQPPRVPGQVVAEEQGSPRHLARGPPGDQPLGVDGLSEPDDPQVGGERLEPGPEPLAHHHDHVDDTGHQRRAAAGRTCCCG